MIRWYQANDYVVVILLNIVVKLGLLIFDSFIGQIMFVPLLWNILLTVSFCFYYILWLLCIRSLETCWKSLNKLLLCFKTIKYSVTILSKSYLKILALYLRNWVNSVPTHPYSFCSINSIQFEFEASRVLSTWFCLVPAYYFCLKLCLLQWGF